MSTGSLKWQLNQTTFVDVTDVTILTTSDAWNNVINLFHGALVSIIRACLPMINNEIKKVVDDLNAKLANNNNTAFLTNVFDPRFPMNLTTTMPPTADPIEKTVTLNFDGTFYDVAAKTNHVKNPNTVDPTRLAGVNSNQFFVHQSLVQSLMMAVYQEYLPLKVNDTNTTALVLQLFPEIKYNYGEELLTELYLDTQVESPEFLTLSQFDGIELGKNQAFQATLIVKCKNASMTEWQTAVAFAMDLQAIVNVTVNPQWKVFLHIPSVSVSGVNLTDDNVGMISRRYDSLLTSVLRSAANNINVQWQKPFDITSLQPDVLPFLSNMITELHITPFYLDQFYYVGFSYFMDQTSVTTGLNTRITELYRDKIFGVFDLISTFAGKMKKERFQ